MTNANGTPIRVSGDTATRLWRAKLPERSLQELIHRFPSVLPIDEIEPGFGRVVPICMELPLEVGAVDNLLMTPEGNLVMVEVKLWGNPQARREVVAQALDYATALFRLDYVGLEAAVKRGDFGSQSPPATLYELIAGADALAEGAFADRVTQNLRRGRIIVLVVGDEIRPATHEFVVGLQAHANFHFTFALVEMPVYKPRLTSEDEFILMPRTLVKTETVQRFTVHTEGGAAVVVDHGTDEVDSRRPSRSSTLSSEEFFSSHARVGP